jgi:SAM-dependent methyltransferase
LEPRSNHWQTYHRRWGGLQPPLRPNREIIDAVVGQVGHRDRRILLLGVTPELAQAFDTVVAVDKSTAMIANVWPGDTISRNVVEADWLTLDGSLGKFSAVVGDGSCNSVAYPDEVRKLLEQVRDHLEPGGRFVCRIFERPDRVPPMSDLLAEAARPATRNFHAFKWQLAMRIAEDTEPSVPVERILSTFERLFPDRDGLSARTGWPRSDIDTIDAYRGSLTVYCFPSRAELLEQLPGGLNPLGFHQSGTYDLAERCPILVCERI